MFTAHDYKILSNMVFNDGYPGYRPHIVESPNGDDNWDTEKRYAHVADKYLDQYKPKNDDAFVSACIMRDYLNKAHVNAIDIAIKLGVPKQYWPVRKYSAMRILEYPSGAITHEHVDFDLFTLMCCYRNIPENFEYVGDYGCKALDYANTFNHQIHFGEILELILPSMKATPHRVVADQDLRTQYSIVYFAIPNHSAVLPCGNYVSEWLDERLARSRKET